MRQLRADRGLTQTELAGERFSKEYISQIERGKTRPTRETIRWLADRLDVDAAFLSGGVSEEDRARVEAVLARAETLTSRTDYREAREALRSIGEAVEAAGAKDLLVRALSHEARLDVCEGDARAAINLLSEARSHTEGPLFTDVDRAAILFQIAVCRHQLSSTTTAISLLTEALSLAERSDLPCDILRSNILGWRSRCYRRQRDLEAAREDVERALELAESINSPRRLADALFNASLVAEREGHLVKARTYAERARSYYEDLADRLNVGKLHNNLGGLHFLLGKNEEAVRHLKDAVATALDVGSQVDAAQAISSLAQVHLRTGEPAVAETHARHALRLLDGREDFLDEIGSGTLILGKALLAQGRLDEAGDQFSAAEDVFERFGSTSHRAAAWMAQAALAQQRRDEGGAARLYQRAAEALQDVRF